MKTSWFKVLLFLLCTNFSSARAMLDVLHTIKKLLPEDPVILEAGGHYGEDTLKMKIFWPKSTIHVFEPHPVSYKRLYNSVSDFPEIFIYPFALASHRGPIDFYQCLNNDGASSLGKPVKFIEPHFKFDFSIAPIVVNGITLDYWKKAYNIKKIDFMWLDLEGFELNALKAGTTLLRDVSVIYSEVNFRKNRETCCLHKELRDWLYSKGFVEIWVSILEPYRKDFLTGEALYLRKDLLHLLEPV